MTATTRDNLAEPALIAVYKDRIARLKPDTPPRWGRMTAAQMMAHCTEVYEVVCGKPLEGTPWYVKLFRPLIRKMVMSDRPFPRETRTHPQYRQLQDRKFGVERERLMSVMDRFAEVCGSRERIDHPLFGPMTVEEAGQAMGKHLNHHLEQFGVGR